jgi:prophage DNA circulation protein
MNSITPYEARYEQRESMTIIINFFFLTFFFAYMGYTLLMNYSKTHNQWEDRMKGMEDHLKTFEENASFIMNELVNSTDEVTELQKEVCEMREDIKCIAAHILGVQGMTQGPTIYEFYKYIKTNVFENINDTDVINKIKSGVRN